jgi:hypothetical protein
MNYKSMFPDFDYELVIPDGYFDSSWKDDVSPSVRKDIHHDLGVKIYCDYADRNKREMGYENQFSVNLEDDQGLTTKGWFDSFEDAVLFANALAQTFKG